MVIINGYYKWLMMVNILVGGLKPSEKYYIVEWDYCFQYMEISKATILWQRVESNDYTH